MENNAPEQPRNGGRPNWFLTWLREVFLPAQMVRSWFNLKTGKIDEKKIETSIFDEVHDD